MMCGVSLFVSQAHSFRQQARLAITLAWIAGYTNIVTLIACGSVSSHMSGITSAFGKEMASGSWGMARYALFLLSSFFGGAAIAGFCTELGRRRRWQSIYVLPIFIEMLLLASFAVLLEFSGNPVETGPVLYWLTGLAACAMGLQNATITHISSGDVRTTHVTGVITDLGFEASQCLWWLLDRFFAVRAQTARITASNVRLRPKVWRLALLGSILGSFSLGAGLGTLAFEHATRWAMFPPVLFLLWLVYQDFSRPIAGIETSALLGAGNNLNLPPALGVFRLSQGKGRLGEAIRMPNLLAWSDGISMATRVVILEVGDGMQLNSNAGLELRVLLERFKDQRRELIISGLNQGQLQQMNDIGMGDLLDSNNVCSDLELAIARGINLLEMVAEPVAVTTGTPQ